MAVIKNAGYTPEIDESQITEDNIGHVDDVIRRTSALQTDIKDTENFEKSKAKEAVGKQTADKSKVAGEEYVEKTKSANPTEVVVSQIATTGTVHAAVDVGAEMYKELKTKDPAKHRDVASASKKMGGMIAGKDATSFEVMHKAKAIKTGPWQNASTKTKDAGEFFSKTKDVTTNAINKITSSTEAVTTSIKSSISSTNIADPAKLAHAHEVKRQVTAGLAPNGMGGGGAVAKVKAMELKHNGPEHGPKFSEEDWA